MGKYETHTRRLAPECPCVLGTGQIGRAQGKYGCDCPRWQGSRPIPSTGCAGDGYVDAHRPDGHHIQMYVSRLVFQRVRQRDQREVTRGVSQLAWAHCEHG